MTQHPWNGKDGDWMTLSELTNQGAIVIMKTRPKYVLGSNEVNKR